MTVRQKTRRGDQVYTRSRPKNWKHCPSKTLPSKQNLVQLKNSALKLDQFASFRLPYKEKKKRTLVAIDEIFIGRDENWKCISLLSYLVFVMSSVASDILTMNTIVSFARFSSAAGS